MYYISLRKLSLFFRYSRPEVFCKKGVLRNFVKFIGKHLRKSLCFKKVAGPRPATLLKKSLLRRCFPVNFTKFLRTPFLQSTSGRLLLQIFKCLDVIKCLSMKRNRHYWITWKVKQCDNEIWSVYVILQKNSFYQKIQCKIWPGN